MKIRKLIFAFTLVGMLVTVGCSQLDDSSTGRNEEIKKTSNHIATREQEVEELSLLSPERFLNIAHRGASGYAPEHTIPAYELGEELAGDYIEIDLQMTKDGELIAMHDSDLSRTTDVSGDVQELNLNEIRVLDVGSWFNEIYPDLANPVFSGAKVPTLDEIFTYFGKESNYYIETKTPNKYPGMEEALLQLLRKHDLLNTSLREGIVIIQSFHKESLLKIQQLDSSIPLIHPYTVNEGKDMERLVEWGVTGMFTNYPDVLEKVLRERRVAE